MKPDAKQLVLKALRNDYTLADNYRKLYVAIIGSEGFDFNAETYISQQFVSDATINKKLEVVLKEMADWQLCRLEGFSEEAYKFFNKCRLKGREKNKEVKSLEGYPNQAFRLADIELGERYKQMTML